VLCNNCTSGYVVATDQRSCVQINQFIAATAPPPTTAELAGEPAWWLTFVIMGGYMFVVLCVYLVLYYRHPPAFNTRFITAALSLFDLVVDVVKIKIKLIIKLLNY